MKKQVVEQNKQIDFIKNVFGLNAEVCKELTKEGVCLHSVADADKARLLQFLNREALSKYNQTFTYKLVNTKYGKRYLLTVKDSDADEEYNFWFRTFALVPVYNEDNKFSGIIVNLYNEDTFFKFINRVSSDTMEEAFTKNSFMKVKKW